MNEIRDLLTIKSKAPYVKFVECLALLYVMIPYYCHEICKGSLSTKRLKV